MLFPQTDRQTDRHFCRYTGADVSLSPGTNAYSLWAAFIKVKPKKAKQNKMALNTKNSATSPLSASQMTAEHTVSPKTP